MNRLMPSLTCVAALALALPLQTSAAIFCVNDGMSLQSALTTAATNDEHDEIRLRAGTYTMSSGTTAFTHTSSQGSRVEISGGWQDFNSIPCIIQQTDPNLTVLDGANQRQVMNLSNSNTSFLSAGFTVQNLTIRGGSGSQFGGLRVSTGTGIVTLERLIIRNNNATTSDSPGGLLVPSVRTIVLNNSLLLDNTCANGPCAARVTSNTATFESIRIHHNTIVRNRCPAIVCPMSGMSIEGTAVAVLGNNAFHDNEGAQLALINPNVTLRHNLLAAFLGTPIGSVGNITAADPGFVNAGSNNYRLRIDSPLFDAGDSTIEVGNVDLDANPRRSGRDVDIGAYELPLLFADGFELLSP